jgi:hypothetical protein
MKQEVCVVQIVREPVDRATDFDLTFKPRYMSHKSTSFIIVYRHYESGVPLLIAAETINSRLQQKNWTTQRQQVHTIMMPPDR